MARHIGVILVHGVGNQRRYDLLKDVSTSFYTAVKRSGATVRKLVVDRLEMNRTSRRAPDASELYSFDGAGLEPGARMHGRLFRPVTVLWGDDSFHFYEVYWADEDLDFSWYEKAKFNLWLLTTMWNPIFNRSTGKYRDTKLGWPSVLVRMAAILAIASAL